MLVLLSLLISRLINRPGLRMSTHSKVFSLGYHGVSFNSVCLLNLTSSVSNCCLIFQRLLFDKTIIPNLCGFKIIYRGFSKFLRKSIYENRIEQKSMKQEDDFQSQPIIFESLISIRLRHSNYAVQTDPFYSYIAQYTCRLYIYIQ